MGPVIRAVTKWRRCGIHTPYCWTTSLPIKEPIKNDSLHISSWKHPWSLTTTLWQMSPFVGNTAPLWAILQSSQKFRCFQQLIWRQLQYHWLLSEFREIIAWGLCWRKPSNTSYQNDTLFVLVAARRVWPTLSHVSQPQIPGLCQSWLTYCCVCEAEKRADLAGKQDLWRALLVGSHLWCEWLHNCSHAHTSKGWGQKEGSARHLLQNLTNCDHQEVYSIKKKTDPLFPNALFNTSLVELPYRSCKPWTSFHHFPDATASFSE